MEDDLFCAYFKLATMSLFNRRKTLAVNSANIIKNIISRRVAMIYTAVRKRPEKQIFKKEHNKISYSILLIRQEKMIFVIRNSQIYWVRVGRTRKTGTGKGKPEDQAFKKKRKQKKIQLCT
ncbi:PREDICTED: uncharacterized protein LOC108358614 [Rhagoletis zephyria]|uniref:uncharacterized protein LOC108358614 n=1 Tax=Rhagoletis zephyria TaxID=28612 RepID=UPI0008117663|nr:PREDICTED: uncharacterized protein LOC108358614 [Rhagoletis zephyria]